VGISVYGRGTVALYVILKDGNMTNVKSKDFLYVPGLRKSLFSWSKLQCLNQHYLEDHGNILVHKTVNDEVILWARECPRTHLFNIPTRPLKVHLTYTF
jgi:hypothetical protein